jgi:S-adenosylmethionine-diacylgycerolhomoserine-N-methlytransferase
MIDTTLGAHAARMDRMYRLQRHVYNVTRKYYLLGRDPMLNGIAPGRGQVVLEIGCGTGRNLIWLAKRFPQARCCGVDASTAMLDVARASIRRRRVDDRVRVWPAMAETMDPSALFGLGPADHVVFSYALSMIGDWRAALTRASAALAPGGTLHIVDFGDFGGLPAWFREGFVRWLAAFGVHHRPELIDGLRAWAASTGAQLQIDTLYGGYAWIARAQTTPRAT